MKKLLLLSMGLVLGLGSLWGQSDSLITVDEDLVMVKVSERVWVHRSYTTLPEYGRFYSNGMIYVIDGACMLFDTPMSEEMTEILLHWIEKELSLIHI